MAMNNPTNLTAPINTGPILISSTTGTTNPPLTFNDTGTFFAAGASVAGYAQAILQNTSNGSTSSADYIVNNDLGTATTYYGDFGMNSSGFTGTGALSAASAVYLSATSGDLAIGTTTSNAIHFVANGAATDALTITSGNVAQIGGRNVATVPLWTPFTNSGTYTPKTTSTWIMYLLVGGGGQGGYGGSYAKASGGSGGGGGGAGGINFGILQASSFGATSTVTVGAGGSGQGNSGTPAGAKGGITSITLAAGARYAGGGGGGGGGTVSATSGGGGSTSNNNNQGGSGSTTGGTASSFGVSGGTGVAGSVAGAAAGGTAGTSGGGTGATGTATAGGAAASVPTGGGSGGGFSAGTPQAGGAGGSSNVDGGTSTPGGGAATGAQGSNGTQNTYLTIGQGFPSSGGGGGGANGSGTGGNGGQGGLGSGGGGGGSGDSGGSFLGGTGGAGGNGYVAFLEG